MRSSIDTHTYRQEQADVKRKAEANEEALLITFVALFKRFMATGERKLNTVRHYYWVMEPVLCDWRNKPVRNITRSKIEAKFVSVKKVKENGHDLQHLVLFDC